MIEKLLDELYWNELKERLESFRDRMSLYNLQGLRYVVDSHPFPYSFIFDHMVHTTQRQEVDKDHLHKILSVFSQEKIEDIYLSLKLNLKDIKKRLIFLICFSSFEEDGVLQIGVHATKEERETFKYLLEEKNLEKIYQILETLHD